PHGALLDLHPAVPGGHGTQGRSTLRAGVAVPGDRELIVTSQYVHRVCPLAAVERAIRHRRQRQADAETTFIDLHRARDGVPLTAGHDVDIMQRPLLLGTPHHELHLVAPRARL